MSAPMRKRLNTYTYKERRLTSNFTVFLRITVFDDGYEEYTVGVRNILTQDVHEKTDHGDDLGSANDDFATRSFPKLVNA